VDTVFYDGHCGLCHRTVRWILAVDADGSKFRFAPLDSEAFRRAVPPAELASLPDSFVVRTEEGSILTRSAAFIRVSARLGGPWRLIAWFLSLIPAAVRDKVYDGVARVRHKWFARPEDACPVIPPRLRSRFDL
jgi:predicted DCC family thiol-disulfide oxidoreductase YuxK